MKYSDILSSRMLPACYRSFTVCLSVHYYLTFKIHNFHFSKGTLEQLDHSGFETNYVKPDSKRRLSYNMKSK